MLVCWRIRLLWGLREISKSVIEIFWDEVFMVRNTMKTGQPFFATISIACSRRSDRGDRAKLCEKEKKQRGGGVGVRARELGVPSLSLFFSLIFFSRSFLRAAFHYPNALNRLQFSPGGFSSTSTSGNPSFWMVLILSDQSQLARAEHLLYCSTLQKTGNRLSAWSKRNQEDV